MTTGRLAQLEGAAAPRAVILRWLEEAHAFPTLPHYAEWLLGQPPDTWPFAVLPGQAAARVRRAMREAREIDILRRAGEAVTETLFRLELVLLINAVIDDRQREAALRYQLLVAEMGLLAHEPDVPDEVESQATDRGRSVAEREAAWRKAVSTQLLDLACSEEACRLLERRYLDGHSALFPRTADRWEATRDAVSEGASLATDVLGEKEEDAAGGGPDGAETIRQAVDLADSARAATLLYLGDSNGARAVTARRLRTASRVPPQ